MNERKLWMDDDTIEKSSSTSVSFVNLDESAQVSDQKQRKAGAARVTNLSKIDLETTETSANELRRNRTCHSKNEAEDDSSSSDDDHHSKRVMNKHKQQGKQSPLSVLNARNHHDDDDDDDETTDLAEAEDIFQKQALKVSKKTTPFFSSFKNENENRNKKKNHKNRSSNDDDDDENRKIEEEACDDQQRQNVLDRVKRVAELFATAETNRDNNNKTITTTPLLSEEKDNRNENYIQQQQERAALSLVDDEQDEKELYAQIATLRLQLRRYKEIASNAQKRNIDWETERFELTKQANEMKIERFKLKSCLDVLKGAQQQQHQQHNDDDDDESFKRTNEEERYMFAIKDEVLEKAHLEMESASKANINANARSVQAMREAQRLEDKLSAYEEASRKENEALMIEASRSRIRAREAKRELEEKKEEFTSIEREIRAELTKKTKESEEVMDEKDKRIHTLRVRLEEAEKRNQFLESRNEELESALESDAGAYYGTQLRKVREAHDEMLTRQQEKLQRVQEELRIERVKAAENKSEVANIKRTLKFRSSQNEKDETAWTNALGLGDDSTTADDDSNNKSNLPFSLSADAASASKRLQMKQQKIELQDSLLNMAKDEIEELRDINRRLLERQTSRSNSAASSFRPETTQVIAATTNSGASSIHLSRTSSRNNNNIFKVSSDDQIPEDDELDAQDFLNTTPYICGASPHKKNGSKLRKNDSSVSLSLRETANDDVYLAPLGSWASFETAHAANTDDDVSLTVTSEEEEEEERREFFQNSKKLQAFFSSHHAKPTFTPPQREAVIKRTVVTSKNVSTLGRTGNNNRYYGA
jgi:hypothetical protein